MRLLLSPFTALLVKYSLNWCWPPIGAGSFLEIPASRPSKVRTNNLVVLWHGHSAMANGKRLKVRRFQYQKACHDSGIVESVIVYLDVHGGDHGEVVHGVGEGDVVGAHRELDLPAR